MNAPRRGLGSICAAIALVALLPSAAIAAYVPPGNSAATQYTEAVPTAGGPKATGKSPNRRSNAPAKVLGGRNAHRLEAQGPAGKAAAEAVAATAPGPVASSAAPKSEATPSQSGRSEGGSGADRSNATNATGLPAGNANDNTSSKAEHAQPNGSSGVGEVIGQATGSSDSGKLGPLLPIAILATIVWSLLYVAKRRKRAAQ